MSENIKDQATATAALNKVRDDLRSALDRQTIRNDKLRDVIVSIRPTGTLTVDEMAESVGRERNYIDSVWSTYGETVRGKQTRAALDGVSEAEREAAVRTLTDAASGQRKVNEDVDALRAERNRLVTLVYGSKILGPSAIAAESGMDRNHVLRLARKAGLTPAWRKPGTSRNQHTKISK